MPAWLYNTGNVSARKKLILARLVTLLYKDMLMTCKEAEGSVISQ